MKRIVTYIVLFILIWYLNSCYTYEHLNNHYQIEEIVSQKRVYVLGAITRQHDTLIFDGRNPARMSDSVLKGLPNTHIRYGSVDSITVKRDHGAVQSFWKNGVVYTSFKYNASGFLVPGKDTVSIPLAQILMMDIKRLDQYKTRLFLALPLGIGTILTVIIIFELITFDLDMDLGM